MCRLNIQNNCWTSDCWSIFPNIWNLLRTDRFPKNYRNAFTNMVLFAISVIRYNPYDTILNAVKVITIILSFIVAVWLISFLSIQLYNDRQRVRQIWLFRYGPDINGLWAIIVCFIGKSHSLCSIDNYTKWAIKMAILLQVVIQGLW